jgi:hypothetical protein
MSILRLISSVAVWVCTDSDQVDDLADLGRRGLEFVDAAIGGERGIAGIVGERAGGAHLLVDFVRRLRQFDGRVGDQKGVAFGVLGLGGQRRGAGLDGSERFGRGAGAAAHGGGRAGDVADHRAEIEFEKVDGFADRCGAARGVGFGQRSRLHMRQSNIASRLRLRQKRESRHAGQ